MGLSDVAKGEGALRRFFVEALNDQDGICVITGSEARHMTRVLRMKPGDRFVLMTGDGRRYEAKVAAMGGREVKVSLVAPLPTPAPSPIRLTLLQSLLKSGPMDYLIQKTSELGVHRIIPFSSERTVVHLNQEQLSRRTARWQKIAVSAAKQSGRSIPMEIGPFYAYGEVIQGYESVPGLKVILWEDEPCTALKDALKQASSFECFTGIIGPEGGFSKEEVRTAGAAGFVPVSLGRRILRAETAAITVAAVVQYERGDLG
ncbi:MAG: 16S rRNA (uracil(1498)-N(3))-methyltransferase [Deltaproteobacteria bacterium]|nr:16S rRNA (uracil(1498)-N(3))-methyltransferase [Deltaproteobacteria bacterium]